MTTSYACHKLIKSCHNSLTNLNGYDHVKYSILLICHTDPCCFLDPEMDRLPIQLALVEVRTNILRTSSQECLFRVATYNILAHIFN